MTLYSTSTRMPALSGPQGTKYEPFVAYAKVVPSRAFGRKAEYHRDLEKKAQKVEDDLIDAGFNVAAPVLFVPQVGQAPARLTIVGFVASSDSTRPPVVPTAKIIHSGSTDAEKTSVMTPVQGTQGWGDLPTTKNQNDVADLKVALETASPGIDIFYISYNGVKYGQLPNLKGFMGFPQ
jgi:hypothetical protein